MDYQNKFKINNFIIYEINSSKVVVQHKDGIIQIHDEQMINFIFFCDNLDSNTVNKSLFDSFFGEYNMEAINFLLNNKVIEVTEEPKLLTNQIKFASNNKEVEGLMEGIVEEYENISGQIISLQSLEEEIHNFRGLNIVFLNPYSKKYIKRLRDLLNEEGYLLSCYIYNGCLYIDSIFSKKLKTPCHLCHMSYIESEIRKERGVEFTYQDLIDSIYSEDLNFQIEIPLLKRDIINIVDKIDMILKNLFSESNNRVEIQKQIKECFKMDLDSRKMYFDQSFHWELCDCYE